MGLISYPLTPSGHSLTCSTNLTPAHATHLIPAHAHFAPAGLFCGMGVAPDEHGAGSACTHPRVLHILDAEDLVLVALWPGTWEGLCLCLCVCLSFVLLGTCS